MSERGPRISVLLPVRNEVAAIRRTLEALRGQSLPADAYEVLMCDGDSTDGTRQIASEVRRNFRPLRVFRNPGRWSSAGRNVGVRHARGEFLIVIDGHCEVPRDYLAKALAAFAATGADALGRPQPLACDRPTPFQVAVQKARGSWLGHNPASAVFSDRPMPVRAENVAVAYRRQVFERIGLFDESFDVCEDVDFNRRFDRAGLTCYFAPEIALAYRPRDTLGKVFHQMFRYGVGRARLAKKDPRSLTPAGLGPPLLIVAGIAAPLAGWVGAAVPLAYGALVLAESLRRAGGPIGIRIRLPALFAAIHLGFGGGFLWEMALGWRPLRMIRKRPLGEAASRAFKSRGIGRGI